MTWGKEKLVQLLWPLANFCGVEVLTYCMMSNHFHLLVQIPPPTELSEEALCSASRDFVRGEADAG